MSIPKKGSDCLRFILFPFKCYIILAPIVLLLLMYGNGSVNLDYHHLDSKLLTQIMFVVHFYVVCIAVLAVGAIFVAIFTRDLKSIWSALIYAAVGFVLLAFLLPAIAPSKQ